MKSKYRNKKTTIDGITFDSKKESLRYSQLKLMKLAGVISDLELQPKYDFIHNGVKICTYKADFRYIFHENNDEYVVEDVKGYLTEIYKIKKKMMKAFYGIDILETY